MGLLFLYRPTVLYVSLVRYIDVLRTSPFVYRIVLAMTAAKLLNITARGSDGSSVSA